MKRASAVRGATLVEVLVALLLTLFLLGLMGGLAVRQRAAGETLMRRMEGVEARRVTRDLVGRTAEDGGGARMAGGELEARVFVGWAVPCAPDGWRYRGRRDPDPERDSLWVLGLDGGVSVHALTGAPGGGCDGLAGDERALRFEVEPPWAAPALVRVFEAGRFRLSDALRYGRRGTPAQPLTGAVLDPAGTDLTAEGSALAVRMRVAGDSLPAARRWWLR
ncbi:MAG: hypothetical protein RQ751_14380 [Longimicrobiales bacterium]|nr:hypothetical protein [Longimicrobiales bacterium]